MQNKKQAEAEGVELPLQQGEENSTESDDIKSEGVLDANTLSEPNQTGTELDKALPVIYRPDLGLFVEKYMKAIEDKIHSLPGFTSQTNE